MYAIQVLRKPKKNLFLDQNIQKYIIQEFQEFHQQYLKYQGYFYYYILTSHANIFDWL